jgi:hypothetical protein
VQHRRCTREERAVVYEYRESGETLAWRRRQTLSERVSGAVFNLILGHPEVSDFALAKCEVSDFAHAKCEGPDFALAKCEVSDFALAKLR